MLTQLGKSLLRILNLRFVYILKTSFVGPLTNTFSEPILFNLFWNFHLIVRCPVLINMHLASEKRTSLQTAVLAVFSADASGSIRSPARLATNLPGLTNNWPYPAAELYKARCTSAKLLLGAR